MSELRALNLPSVFVQMAVGRIPAPISGRCKPTTYFREIQKDLASRFPPAAEYVPLWMTASFGVVAFAKDRGEFVRYNIGESRDQIIAANYQQLCAYLFFQLIDSGLWAELDELSALFEFRYLEELKDFSEKSSEPFPEGLQTLFAQIEEAK